MGRINELVVFERRHQQCEFVVEHVRREIEEIKLKLMKEMCNHLEKVMRLEQVRVGEGGLKE